MKTPELIPYSMQYNGTVIRAFMDGSHQAWLYLDDVIAGLKLEHFKIAAANLVPTTWKQTMPGSQAVFINEPGLFKLAANYDPSGGVAFVEWFMQVMKPKLASTISRTGKPATIEC